MIYKRVSIIFDIYFIPCMVGFEGVESLGFIRGKITGKDTFLRLFNNNILYDKNNNLPFITTARNKHKKHAANQTMA